MECASSDDGVEPLARWHSARDRVGRRRGLECEDLEDSGRRAGADVTRADFECDDGELQLWRAEYRQHECRGCVSRVGFGERCSVKEGELKHFDLHRNVCYLCRSV